MTITFTDLTTSDAYGLFNGITSTSIDNGFLVTGQNSFFGFPRDAFFSKINADGSEAIVRQSVSADLLPDTTNNPSTLIGVAPLEAGGVRAYYFQTFAAGGTSLVSRDFGADGTPATTTVELGTQTSGGVGQELIDNRATYGVSANVVDSDGNFVVLMNSTLVDGGLHVFAQDGTVTKTVIPVTGALYTRELVLMDDGTFIVSASGSGPGETDLLRVNLETGVTSPFATIDTGNTFRPEVVLEKLADGTIAVSYASLGANSTLTGYSVMTLNTDGSVDSAPVLVPFPTDVAFSSNPQLWALADGGVVLAYQEGSGTNSVLNRLDANLALQGTFEPDGRDVVLGIDPNGSGVMYDQFGGTNTLIDVSGQANLPDPFAYYTVDGANTGGGGSGGGGGPTGPLMPDADQVPVPLGEDFDIGRLTGNAGAPADHQIAELSDGTLILVWAGPINVLGTTGYQIPDAQGAVYGQMFSKDGQLIGQEFQISATASGLQNEPMVVAHEGSFSVLYSSGESGSEGLHLSTFSNTQTVIQQGVLLTPGSDPVLGGDVDNASIAALANGNVAVVLERDANGQPAIVQEFQIDGTQVGSAIALSGKIDQDLHRNIDILDNGDVVIVLEDPSGATEIRLSGPSLQSAPAGDPTAAGPVTLTTIPNPGETQEEVTVAALDGGGFVVAYHETRDDMTADRPRQLVVEVFDGAGQSQGRVEVGAPQNGTLYDTPALVGTEGGGFAVAFAEDDFDLDGIYLAAFNADLSVRMELMRINPRQTGLQDFPSLLDLGGGEVMVTYGSARVTDPNQITPVEGIRIDLDNPSITSEELGGLDVKGSAGIEALVLSDEVSADLGRAGDSVTLAVGSTTRFIDGGEGSDAVQVSQPIAEIEVYDAGANGVRLKHPASGLDIEIQNVETFFFGLEFRTLAQLQAASLGDGGPLPGSTATAGDDVTLGTDGDDTIDGGAGDDRFLALAGTDTFTGGAGTDTVVLAADGLNDLTVTEEADGALTIASKVSDAVVTVREVETFRVGPNSAFDYTEAQIRALIDTGEISGTTGNDTLNGTADDDLIDAGAGDDTIFPMTGTDTIQGGPGTDTLVLPLANTDALYVIDLDGGDNLRLIDGASGDSWEVDGIETFRIGAMGAELSLSEMRALIGAPGDAITGTNNAENVVGTPRSEQINALAGGDWITPGGGSDTIDGGAGRDMLSFFDLPDLPSRTNLDYRLDIDMEAGTAVSHDGSETIQFTNIERVTGTIFADRIRGTDGDDELRGLGDYDWFVATEGNDTYNGGTGRDVVSYVEATSAVTVDLAAGQGLVGMAQGHSYIDIERVTGSVYADLFYGDAGENDFRGLGGYDTFVGSTGGRERYDGGSGLDTVTYFQSDAGVTASLLLGYGSGGDAARDLYTSIENLGGTNFDDVLTGDNDRNNLRSLGGDDLIFGNGGIDRIKGGRGDDTIDGGSGSDYILFDGNSSDFQITRTGTRDAVVSWTGPGAGEGTDQLFDVEYLVFDDQTIDIWSL